MSYCIKCGRKLVDRYLENEGVIPYCENCKEYRFKMYNVAISMIVIAPNNKILLIKQYHKNDYILVAGYVNYSESIESALKRELKEETDLELVSYKCNKSQYYEPSNTLMVNFICYTSDDNVHNNYEIDSYQWFYPDDALVNIKPNSLAKQFLAHYLANKI